MINKIRNTFIDISTRNIQYLYTSMSTPGTQTLILKAMLVLFGQITAYMILAVVFKII